MRPRFVVGTTSLLGFLVVGFAIRPTALQGQASDPFGFIRASDTVKHPSPGLPNGPATAAQVLEGRALVVSSSCTECHNRGKTDPNDPQWLAGAVTGNPQGTFAIGPFTTYSGNLTPDKQTGIGDHSERQIFNALRFGLDPEDTPDGVITSNVPGQGNFPADPHYLAPPMPWPSFRHKTDEELWAIVAYLKHGIKPVNNTVTPSQGPPDHWASSYTPDKIGPYPLPAYPAGNETFTP
jgi:hypothetical protein